MRIFQKVCLGPKFSDTYLNSIPICPPSARLHLNFPSGYVPAFNCKKSLDMHVPRDCSPKFVNMLRSMLRQNLNKKSKKSEKLHFINFLILLIEFLKVSFLWLFYSIFRSCLRMLYSQILVNSKRIKNTLWKGSGHSMKYLSLSAKILGVFRRRSSSSWRKHGGQTVF